MPPIRVHLFIVERNNVEEFFKMLSRTLMLVLAITNASLLCMEPKLNGDNLLLWKLFDTLGSNNNPEKWQSAKHTQLLDVCKNKTLDQARKSYLCCQGDEDIGAQPKKEVKALSDDDQEKSY
jgi:hypothetical protein